MAADRISGGRPVGRRAVLSGALAVVAAAGLAGCDIRLQDDAPSIPLVPRRSVPDEAVLVDAVRRTLALAQTAARVTAPTEVTTRLSGFHTTQASVLRARLTAQGVPNHVIDPPSPATTTGAPTAAVSAPPPVDVGRLRDGEQAAVAALAAALPTVTAANRAVLASVAACCGAAVEQLGATPAWPSADPLPATAAVSLLDQTRAAAYAFQVVAGQGSGDLRARALATRADLMARGDQLTATAGASAPTAPLGYALPFPVTDAASANRLATQVLTTLVAGGLAPLPGLPEGSTALVTLVRLLVDAQRIGRGWGVDPVPFPGQAYP